MCIRDRIKSIEDPFAENDWKSWNKLMKSLKKVQIVGDDLYVTNLERLKKGFLNLSSNAILIKLNQIGTVSETLDVIRFAQAIGFQIQGGTILGDLPPYEAFCMGGTSSVRGWGSCDLAVSKSFIEGTVEYRFPVWKMISGALLSLIHI